MHRDLEPSNIMLLAEGGLKVLDFGIARLAADEAVSAQLTAPNMIVGTPAYMSPEAVAGKEVGPPTDLHALGILFFEMITGRCPFQSQVPAVLLTKHLTDPAPRMCDVRPDVAVPVALESLVARLLAKKASSRPRDASEVASALTALAQATQTTLAVPRRARWIALRPWIATGAVAAAIGMAIGIGVALRDDPPEPPAAVPAPPIERHEEPPAVEPAPPPTVELRITTTPADATILLDGAERTSPLVLPRDGAEHAITVRAPGHREARARCSPTSIARSTSCSFASGEVELDGR